MVDSDENITKTIENINPVFSTEYSMVRSSKIFLNSMLVGKQMLFITHMIIIFS